MFRRTRFSRQKFDRPRSPDLRLSIESLEDRNLLAASPTMFEQELLEHVNRFRTDPQGELDHLFASLSPLEASDADVDVAIDFFNVDANTLLTQWSNLGPVSPLAWNSALNDAATIHSQLMIDNDEQSHQLPGEPELLERLVDAGYNWSGSVQVGENVFAYALSAIYAHAGFAIDWGDGPGGIQQPAGHRDNLMNPVFQEVGIGVLEDNDPSSRVGPFVVTQNLGQRGNYGNARIVGVIYSDQNGNGRFDAGEGHDGASVRIQGSGGTFNVTTWDTGGYQQEVPPGSYTVSVTGIGFANPVIAGSVTVGSENVKVDLDAITDIRGTIEGRIYDDRDTDGVLDASDAGLAGWKVFLDEDSDGKLDLNETMATTDSSGRYSFDNVVPGNYSVRQIPESRWATTNSSGNSTPVSVSPGQTVEVNFGNYIVLEIAGKIARLYGTSSDDTVTFSIDSKYRVKVNRSSFSLLPGLIETIEFQAGAGVDSASFVGGSGSDNADIQLDLAQLQGPDYVVRAINVETVMIDSGGGLNERAILFDSPNDDRLDADPQKAVLVGSGFEFTAAGFDRVLTNASTGNDFAVLVDSTSSDRFYGRSTYSVLRGENYEFYNLARGFDRVAAHARNGGEKDYAYLYDSAGNERFVAKPTFAFLEGSTFYNYAGRFDRVYGYATAGGDNDRAYLYDDPERDDSFYGKPTYGLLRGKNFEYYNFASQFDRVFAYATPGVADDRAYLYDSEQNDKFYGRSNYGLLRGDNFEYYNYAGTFDRVYAYASEGDDRAFLYDSEASDFFFGNSKYALLRDNGFNFYNYAGDFDRVIAYATQGGTNDRATVHDSEGTTGSWAAQATDTSPVRGSSTKLATSRRSRLFPSSAGRILGTSAMSTMSWCKQVHGSKTWLDPNSR